MRNWNAQDAGDALFQRKMLMKLLSIIKFLPHQGLAVPGSHGDIHFIDGNLYHLLSLQAQEDLDVIHGFAIKNTSHQMLSMSLS